jgi:SAM-dependent methyltransferase
MPFEMYSAYYDLLYSDKDYLAEVNYVMGLIDGTGHRTLSLLELGCGTGIHASLFAERGMRVCGVDLSESMLARAEMRKVLLPEAHSKNLNFVVGDARTFRCDEQFDAVISLFHVIGYQTTNGDIMAFFETVTRHLKPGGLLIFDFWYGPAVLVDRPSERVKHLENDLIEVVRTTRPILLPNRNRVDVNFEISVTEKNSGENAQFKELHPVRYFFLPELEYVLESFGFDTCRVEQWLTGAQPGLDTWGVCMVAKKRQ